MSVRAKLIILALLCSPQILFNPLYAARDPFHSSEEQELPIRAPIHSGLFKLDAEDIPVADLLRKIAASGGSNVLLSSGVTGSIGVHFEGLPWQEALDTIIQQQGLQLEDHGTVLWIGPGVQSLKQVRIKARIVELTDQASQALGLELNQSFSDMPSPGIHSLKQSFSVRTIEQGSHFNLGWGYLPSGFHLDLELAVLETEGSARVISSPELLVLNHEEAWIHQGKEIPYMTYSKEEASVSFKKAVLSLKVTPHIIDERHTKLLLEVNKDGVSVENPGLAGIPTIDTRQLSTTILAQNEQTIVLGGIIELIDHTNRSYLPWMRNIPGFSWLLGREEHQFEKKEVMLFLTVAQDNSVFK